MGRQRHILFFALAASLASLVFAFTAQYGLGLMPCELCIMQRLPYAAVVLLTLIGLAASRHARKILVIVACLFVVGSGIAVYHSAVEKHIVRGPTTCTFTTGRERESLEEFTRRIENAPAVACDQPAWEYHGITMASLNACWSFILAIVTLYLLYKGKKNAPPAG